MVFQPRPQLLAAHPVDASGTGVTLDPSERRGEILAGHEQLPQASLGGVRSGVVWRRGWAVLWPSALGLHPQAFPTRPLAGLAAFNVHPSSTHVLRLASRSALPGDETIPPVLWPLLTSPQRTVTSRSPLSHATRRTRQARPGIQAHPWRSPQVRPATFTTHPPHIRLGPLMA